MKIDTIKILINGKWVFETSQWPNCDIIKDKIKVTKQGRTLRIYIKTKKK